MSDNGRLFSALLQKGFNLPAAFSPKKKNLLRLLILLLAPVVLAACSVMQEKPPGQADETSRAGSPFNLGLNDAFQRVDDAIRRVGKARDDLAEGEQYVPDDEGYPDLLARAQSRFAFAQCDEGSRALAWAQWYADRPDYMERVLNRAYPWLYDILTEIEYRDLPGELIVLPIVESAYDPFAYSRSRAAGTWQFLSGTARDFGIEINDAYDGRRDVFAATRAALDYLAYLGELFDNDWNLALAAYNAGQGRVQRAMRRNASLGRGTDWASLPLPRETQAYVPKINGLGCLFADPERFDFALPVWENQPKIARVELDGPIDIVQLSSQADLELAELLVLNAGLNGHMTSPTGPHHVIVPLDRAEDVIDALPSLDAPLVFSHQTITVQRGDTLSRLANRYNTSIVELREANQLNGDLLRVGQQLRIPSVDAIPADPLLTERYAELASLQEQLLPRRRHMHQVRPGESLWTIARQYRVGIQDIQRWNNLGQSTLIRPGQQLAVTMEPVQRPTNTSAPQAINYTVRNGDSLWLIARRHNVRVNDLLEWNQLEEGAILRPGQRLRIRPNQSS